MSGKNRRLDTNEPVEFEKYPIEVGDFKRSTDRFLRNLWNMPQMNESKTRRYRQHVTGWLRSSASRPRGPPSLQRGHIFFLVLIEFGVGSY
jgi:hypothetical protein